MYVLIGGRKTQSGLYRIRYAGKESTAPADHHQPNAKERELRHELEALHVGDHPDDNEKAWPHLVSSDSYIRSADSAANEQQPLDKWQARAMAETDPQASITALLAVSRKVPRTFKPTGPDLDTPPPAFPADNAERHSLQGPVFAALGKLDWSKLSVEQQLELLRAFQLALYRLGPPGEKLRAELIARLDAIYPAQDRRSNVMLTELMCYLQAPSAAKKGIELLAWAPAQEEQINLVRSLQYLKAGWNVDLHRELFKWFVKAQAYRGGNNFPTFIQEMRNSCLANTPVDEQKALADIINTKLPENGAAPAEARPFVKEWKMDDVLPLIQTKLTGRDFEHGKKMFAAASCYACHHFAGDGGAVGPDLTGLAGRFSPRDILESVLDPDKVISDQYAASMIITDSGKTIVGRITNYSGEGIVVNTNMQDPNATVTVDRNDIESMQPSKTSMMPTGLLNTLHEDELLDLMAFLLSRGDPQNAMFAKTPRAATSSSGGN
jgi:putative heme-binding domain-containing protein